MTIRCSVDDCTRNVKYKGMCGMHYKRTWRHGDPNIVNINKLPATKCAIDDCQNLIGHSSGYCTVHYQRAWRYGRFETIKVPDGTGTINAYGYYVVGGRYEHRMIAAKKLGRPLKPGEVVHHIDGNRLNNHPDNLEVLPSQSEHMKLHRRGG